MHFFIKLSKGIYYVNKLKIIHEQPFIYGTLLSLSILRAVSFKSDIHYSITLRKLLGGL